MAITVEEIEALAESLAKENEAARAKLLRLIKAEARVLFGREPEQFEQQPTEWSDTAGHFDSSYPPKQEYYNHVGPRVVVLIAHDTEEIPTSGGFYYDWKLVTRNAGIAVAQDGTLYGVDSTGTGKLGQFAAYPGDCNVQVELEWYPLNGNNVTLEQLHEAERVLREMAFPASAAA